MANYADAGYFLELGQGATGPGLVTLDVLGQSLSARGLDAAQTLLLPGLNAAASELIRKHCNRYFNRRPSADGTLSAFDGTYHLDYPSRSFLLRQFPVNRIIRVRTDLTAVLSVRNTDTTVNQQATVAVIQGAAPDVADVASAVSGLTLWRIASGIERVDTIDFAAIKILSAVRDAINVVGGGWMATVLPGYEAWPTADIRGGGSALPALSGMAQLYMHTGDGAATFDGLTGLCNLSSAAGSSDPFDSPRWGDGGSSGDPPGSGGVRVIYDAGFDVVPGPIQEATIETVADMLSLLETDQRLGSESDGSYSYTLGTALASYALPRSVLGKIDYYRNHR